MDVNKTYSDLQAKGYSVINNFLTDVSDVKNEVFGLLENIKDDSSYKFGKALRLGSIKENHSKNPDIFKVLGQNWMIELAKEYLKKDQLFTEIFITNDFRNDRGIETNGILHFDKFHTLKYMLYLSDCDKSSGAFCCVPGSHIDGKFLREKAWQETQVYENIKNKPLEDYRGILEYSEKDVIALEGNAGTLIIFETDVFHRGGIVEDNKERLLIRSHFHDGSRWGK